MTDAGPGLPGTGYRHGNGAVGEGTRQIGQADTAAVYPGYPVGHFIVARDGNGRDFIGHEISGIRPADIHAAAGIASGLCLDALLGDKGFGLQGG